MSKEFIDKACARPTLDLCHQCAAGLRVLSVRYEGKAAEEAAELKREMDAIAKRLEALIGAK